jgi:hypothetical protein
MPWIRLNWLDVELLLALEGDIHETQGVGCAEGLIVPENPLIWASQDHICLAQSATAHATLDCAGREVGVQLTK